MSSTSLLDFITNTSSSQHVRIEQDLGHGYVLLRISEAEKRQAKDDIRCVEDILIELLRNSRDAGANRIFVATGREGSKRYITVIDDGSGIPLEMHERVFEARVTSKLDSAHPDTWGYHGRGMALYSIAQSSLSSRVAASDVGKGCSIEVIVDTDALSERADQHTWPTIDYSDVEVGSPDVMDASIRGPHNLIRSVVEFSLSTPQVETYYGSASDIVATLAHLSRRASEIGESSLHLPYDLGSAMNANDLCLHSANLGLAISSRTAHRIIAGQIAPLEPVLQTLAPMSDTDAPALDGFSTDTIVSPDTCLTRDARGLRITSDDLADFSNVLKDAFGILADRYYLSLSGEPRIKVRGGEVHITLPFEKLS